MASDIDWSTDPDLAALISEREKHLRLGYDDAHDANEFHSDGQLAMAACYMAWPAKDPHLFPHDWDIEQHTFRFGKSRYDQLRVAGGFILAEMRRLRIQAEGGPSDA